MKITVLVDNQTLIDKYYLAEPALSLYIEAEGKHILFDTGYSDVVIRNSTAMGIDLNEIDTIVLSHGHNDHTGGLKYLTELTQKIDVICCEGIDEKKAYHGLDISCPFKLSTLASNFVIHQVTDPYYITDKLVFLGRINRNVQKVNKLENDELWDDSALAYNDDNGVSIITGCSHSGICNIIDYAKRVTNKHHIKTIIGGFHMLNDKEQNQFIANYIAGEDIETLYPCHCVDLQAKMALNAVIECREIGVSSIIQL